jgi:hypothetical protein
MDIDWIDPLSYLYPIRSEPYGDNMLLATGVSGRRNDTSQIMVECYGYIKAVRNALLAQS